MFEQLIVIFDIIFGPLSVFKPHISLLIVSSILTVIVLLLGKLAVNKNLLKEIKTKMEEIKENLAKAQKENNTEQINNFLAEMMKLNGQFMKQNFKSMIISLVVISLFLPWLGAKYGGASVAALPVNIPFIGSSLSWMYWYILVSLAVGWVIRKLIEAE